MMIFSWYLFGLADEVQLVVRLLQRASDLRVLSDRTSLGGVQLSDLPLGLLQLHARLSNLGLKDLADLPP